MDCAPGNHRVNFGELRFINGDYICDECAHDVANLLVRALAHEIDYPPTHGNHPVDIRPYLEYLPPNFLQDYTNRRHNTRGVEYQLCSNPACHTPTFLGEGCNHMICPYCDTHFCHLCGGAAPEHNGHWLPGGCPRFGQPDVPRPQSDYPTDEHGNIIGEEDNETEDEDEEVEDSGPLIPDKLRMVLPELLDSDGVMPFRETIRQLGVRERGRAIQNLRYYLHTDFITAHNAPWLAERFNHANLTIASQDLSWTQPMLDLVHSLAAWHLVGFRNSHPPRSLGEILYVLQFLIMQAQALQCEGSWEHDVEWIDERFAEMHDILTDPDIE
ncbi:hypothetical protein LTR95_018083, partial [Oleoguttula sp. CCFEE 5521]